MKEQGILAIAKRVATALNLNDEGKINRFYKREIKKAKGYISDLQFNLEVLKREKTKILSVVSEQTEDAETTLAEAYEYVDVDAIRSNSACDEYSEVFWERVRIAKNALEDVKTAAQSNADGYDAQIADTESQIEKYQERIDTLSK